MEIYIIPCHEKEKEYIIYAPLQNFAFTGNQNAANIVKKHLSGVELSKDEIDSKVWRYLEQIENTSFALPESKNVGSEDCAVIILSQSCNLACTYCYAQEARSKTILSKEKIVVLIDGILSKKPHNAEFVFIGGGEPFVTWRLLRWTIDYIYCNKDKATNVKITITTNATLLTDEMLVFIKQHDIHLGISFDILPNIQNSQRVFANTRIGSFESVDASIRKIENSGISFSFRSTISKPYVSLMPEMVRFVHDKYKSVSKLHFEPIMSLKDNDKRFYDDFIESFMKARKIGSENGIIVYNSISNSIDKINSRFCRGELCITPTGAIVACHRISSESESLFDSLNYGIIDEILSISESKRDKIYDIFNKKNTNCTACFAKWHCAGGCPIERLIQTPNQQLYKCQFTRQLIARLLEERLV